MSFTRVINFYSSSFSFSQNVIPNSIFIFFSSRDASKPCNWKGANQRDSSTEKMLIAAPVVELSKSPDAKRRGPIWSQSPSPLSNVTNMLQWNHEMFETYN